MTLHRSTPEERAPPWGRTFAVEDVFDLKGRGTVLQVRAKIPSPDCIIRLSLQGTHLQLVGSVDRPAGDAIQSTILVTGISASEIPRGTMLEILSPNDR